MRRELMSMAMLCTMVGTVLAQTDSGIVLPQPGLSGEHSLESLLAKRRSVRDYSDAGLTLAEVGQLLWAAQGITHQAGLRTAPSAGALYPLELYLVSGQVEGLAPALYHYQAQKHRLLKLQDGDLRKALMKAAFRQSSLSKAAAVVVFTADYARTSRKYGRRAERYVHIEVGHAVQNLYLQAEALGLGTVMVGAFQDGRVQKLLALPEELAPLGLMPVGRK